MPFISQAKLRRRAARSIRVLKGFATGEGQPLP